MKWVPRKLLQLGWNQRPLTQEDFDLCCQEEGIEVIEIAPLPVEGFYTERRGLPVIVVNQRTRGLRHLLAEFHELCHYLLHSPDSATFSRATLKKINHEAEALALCAILPEPLLRKLVHDEAPEEDTFLYEILTERLKVMELYGI